MTRKPPVVRLLLIAGLLFAAAAHAAPSPRVPHLSLALTTPHFSFLVTL
jgi:hypothetical protein